MFCKNCGKLLGSEDKFCANCGTRVTVEPPKPAEPEPMFFVEKREEPIVEKKARKVVHLDEFNWDLNGYPTEKRKTEAVDFDWASVLEDKIRQASPKPVEEKPAPKKEVADPLGEMPKTVEDLLAALPDNVLEIVEEPEEPVEEVVQEPAEEVAEEPAAEEKEIKVNTLEQIIEDFGEGPMDEPTRLIDKAQMKADSVESFYVFSKKQAEYQNLLDQEYDRIQNSLMEQEEPTPTVEEILAELGEEPVEKPAEEVMEEPVEEPVEETMEEPAEEPVEEIMEEPVEEPVEETMEEPDEEPAAEAEEVNEEGSVEEVPVDILVTEEKEPELVAVVWSIPPAGIVIEKEEETVVEEPVEEPAEEPVEEPAEEMQEESESAGDETPAEPLSEEPVKEQLTFADIFNDEDDEEEEERKGGGCLKFIAVVLMILVILELGILGIQHFAGDSEAAKYINLAYSKVVSLIDGIGESVEEPADDPADNPVEEPAEEPEGPSEIAQLIAAQQGKNTGIGEIVENAELVFDASQDYGYEELPNAYAFKNSPWYDAEDGTAVTYGDEIVGALIQYYSALPSMINGVDEIVLEYVDPDSPLYTELEGIAGDAERGYSVNRLEIGEIKTGEQGFYAMVKVTSADRMQPEEDVQTQIVYLEANPDEKVVRIKETKNL